MDTVVASDFRIMTLIVPSPSCTRIGRLANTLPSDHYAKPKLVKPPVL